MPVIPGRSGQVVSRNIRELVKEGTPLKQAVAISLKEAQRLGGRRPKPRRSKVVRG